MEREPYTFKEWNLYEGDRTYAEFREIAHKVSKELKKYNLSSLEAEIVLKLTKSICKHTRMASD